MDESRRLTGANAPLDRLDRALSRALAPPALPSGFVTRLRVATTFNDAAEIDRRRQALEQEWTKMRRRLDVRRQQLGLTTLVSVAGGAVLSATVLFALLPWARALQSGDGLVLLAWVGTATGIAAAAAGSTGLLRPHA